MHKEIIILSTHPDPLRFPSVNAFLCPLNFRISGSNYFVLATNARRDSSHHSLQTFNLTADGTMVTPPTNVNRNVLFWYPLQHLTAL